MDRLIANRAIIAILAVEVEKPNTDQWYEESRTTLAELDQRNAGC